MRRSRSLLTIHSNETNGIGVHAGDSKLMLLGITYYCWVTTAGRKLMPLRLHALVDGKKIIITEASVRRDLQLADGEDEAAHKELGDSLVRAATTSSSLETEQDSGNINKTQSKATPNKSSSLGTTSGGGPRGNTLRSDEDRLKLDELMALCTTLQNMVLDLKKTKTAQHNEIASLKRRVKKLKKKNRSRTHKLKRLYKVGLTARVESSDNEESLGEDASKQGRINDIDADDEITLVSVQNVDEEMFDVNVLDRGANKPSFYQATQARARARARLDRLNLHSAHFLPLEFISDHFIRLSMATTQVLIVLDDSTFNPSMNQDDLVIGDEDASNEESFLDKDWKLNKWVLNFVHVPPPHRGINISDALYKCFQEWDIKNKYIASQWISEARTKTFNDLVQQMKLPNNKLILDCKTRWNSTYEMLVGASKFKEVFPKYEERDPDFDSCPLKNDWVRVEKICEILEVFNNVTHIISGSDYPTSNLFLCEVYKVKQVLDGKKDDESEFIRKMVEKMKEKFDKYWAEVHLVMVIAAVLDPRVKMWSLEFIFPKIYNSVDEKDLIKMVEQTLRSLHSEYVTIYNESTTESNEKNEQKVAAKEKDDEVNVVEVINTAKTVSAVTTTTATITTVDDVTLAQALMEIKSTKPKEKGDKGKGILIEPMKPMKKKDLIRLDEEGALKLQAELDEEERLAREKAEKEKEANIALIETWDDIQAKIDDDHQLKK
ncbi:putative ribonuclease H-like domain-containing protein [Tanacetum coccineum]